MQRIPKETAVKVTEHLYLVIIDLSKFIIRLSLVSLETSIFKSYIVQKIVKVLQWQLQEDECSIHFFNNDILSVFSSNKLE